MFIKHYHIAVRTVLITAIAVLFMDTVPLTAQTVTPATGGNAISADNVATATWTTLTGPVIEETSPGQLLPGEIRFQAPSGFEWDTGGTDPSVAITGPGGVKLAINFVSRSATVIVFEIVTASTPPPPNRPGIATFSDFRIRPTAGTPLVNGEIRNIGSAAPGGTTNYGTIAMVAGADNRTRVETAATAAGAVVSAQDLEAGDAITVYANVRDQYNNFKRNDSGATWSLQNITGGVVTGDLAGSGGSAVLTGALAGSATIRAVVAGVPNNVESGTITVVPSDAESLVITTEPSTTATAGAAFATQPVVAVRDAFGNTLTADNFTQITATRLSGTGTLQGTTTLTVSGGVATFTNLSHNVANTIDIRFTATGLTADTSGSIAVSAAAASTMIFTQQPSNGNRNAAISPPVKVQLTDVYGNYVSQIGTTITLTINSGTGNISDNVEVTDANGEATFPNLQFNQTGLKNIVADATGLTTSPVSNDFTIAQAGTLAGFLVETTGGGTIGTQTAGTGFSIRITAVDGANSVLDGTMGKDNFTGNVNLTTSSAFSSSTTITNVGPFVNGVFDPHAVNLELAGTGLTITATNSAGTEAGSSNAFTVNPAVADADSSIISASDTTLIADGTSTSVITVQLVDAFGNPLNTGGDAVGISILSGGGSLSSVSDNTDGTYTATLTASNTVGTAEIGATVNSASITSGNVTVTYTFDVLSTFLVEAVGGGTIPTQTAGSSFNIQITALDAFDNVVTSFNGAGNTVQITSDGTLTAGGGTTAVFTNGVLASHAVTITTAGSTTITARRTGFTEQGSSVAFTVNPAATDLGNSTITPGISFLQNNGSDNTTITVQLIDAFGNNLNTNAGTVALLTTAGTIGGVFYAGGGSYTATLTAGATPATATVTGTFNGNPFTDDAVVTITQFNNWTAAAGGNPANKSKWTNTGNWSLGSVPTTGQVVRIPGSLSNYPIIDDTDPTIDFLVIESGGNVNLSSRTITINNELSGAGSFYGTTSTVNLNGDVLVANFIAGTSTVNLGASSTQTISGDFTANTININQNTTASQYLEAFSAVTIATGQTLTMQSGSELLVLGDITIDGALVGNGSTFTFGGDINGSNITLTNTSVTLNGSAPQEINGITTIKSFTIDNPTTVTVNNDLAITDTLTITDGELIVASGYNLVTNVTEGETENIRMLREIAGTKGWRLLSSPLSSTYADLLSGTITQGFPNATYYDALNDTLQPNVLYYEESFVGTDNQRWRAPADATDALTAGRGLFVYFFDEIAATIYNSPLPDTLNLSGAEFTGSGTEVILPVTYTASADTGWNLVGNPYAATVDWDDGTWLKTNMDNVIYVWDAVTEQYLTWNGTTGSLGNGLIAPFQGFWVKANGSGTPSLRVRKTSKTTGAAFYKTAQTEANPLIALELSANGMSASTYFSFLPDAKTSKDDFDAYRLLPLETISYLDFYSTLPGGAPISINNLPRKFGYIIEIPIETGGYQDGVAITDAVFELRVRELEHIPPGWTVTLRDNQTGEAFILSEMPKIQVHDVVSRYDTIQANTMQNFRMMDNHNKGVRAKAFSGNTSTRFTLRIDPGSDADGLPSRVVLDGNYPNPFNPSTTIRFGLPIEANVLIDVFDILGRKVTTVLNESRQAGFHEVRFDARQMASGIYLYRLSANGEVMTGKMLLLR